MEASLTVPVIHASGEKSGKMTLPDDIFGVKVNKPLLAQSVRVYLANQRKGLASTKTRGEVEGSTRKIYRQKGTGKARHGGIRAPIFVGGGIAFGPKPRNYHLDLPKKMKKHALVSALTNQYHDGNITVVEGLGSIPPKTKVFAGILFADGATRSTLLVVVKGAKNVILGARNLNNLDILPVEQLHTYAVLSHSKIIFMKEALGVVSDMINKNT